MNRRRFLYSTLACVAGATGLGGRVAGAQTPKVENVDKIAKITKTPDEWRKVLTPVQFDVLREEGTERPFTSPLNHEKRKGTFVCAGCALPLFDSATKYDSGTGWPSFYDCIKGHVAAQSEIRTSYYAYSEYHCARCGGHHGHIFNDGPKPTGLRYCENGVAIRFVPA